LPHSVVIKRVLFAITVGIGTMSLGQYDISEFDGVDHTDSQWWVQQQADK